MTRACVPGEVAGSWLISYPPSRMDWIGGWRYGEVRHVLLTSQDLFNFASCIYWALLWRDCYPPGSLLGAKNAALAKIQEIGIPTTRVVTGLFIEFIPWATSSASKPGKFVISGKGDKKVSFTSVLDIGGYVAHILTSYPLPELYNKSLIIEGQAATFQEVAQILGRKFTHVSPEEIDQPLVRALQGFADKGIARTGYILTDADASEEVVNKRSSEGNALWKGHQWKQIKDIHAA